MFFKEELIGQGNNIELFNNIGCIDNLEGRLTVWLAIHQTPRVHWEFEAARGGYNSDFTSLNWTSQKLTSWNGSDPQFVVEKPTFTFRGGRRQQIRGYAERALYGDINADAHYFDFYLPNTDFLREATGCKLADVSKALKCESFLVEISNNWSIELSTNQDALDWLKPEAQNRGSMITLKIQLFQSKQHSTKIQELSNKSLSDASTILSDLCLMLSYINGGYIKSIYAVARKFVNMEEGQIVIEDVASLAEAPLIVPQEELGQGCIRYFGMNDLLDLLQCFPTFQRMLQTTHWKEKWIVLLEWYFQAIPRVSGRRRNVFLPVVANALGTLLENLARLVLVDDASNPSQQEKDFNNRSLASRNGYNGISEYRIDTLLQRIGISSDRDLVIKFIRIRNNATHAGLKPSNLTAIEEWEVVQKAIQWVDEVVLWRIGYGGQYRKRSLYSTQGIQPRYDLSQRESSW
ncbi:hypothetical protein [Geitlerinema sp. PCC 7407]|uniref:hypothetical protein n=1 Tax=Geitlerinema sp. PCC 7407 TaxID=1173025 RepID=UPI00029FD6A9|nr:hypothetical protein [Geitlerinema sp. PCC 7407]AFY66677.1 hypothetical protein GEI7407_2197 [Geitlerinema sp. PCC 7407]